MTRARVLVTGVTGQDGRYLARLAHAEGYEVFGTSRTGAVPDEAFHISAFACDLRDQRELTRIVADVAPVAVFNFAALSTGAGMFDAPLEIGDVNGLAVARLLEAVREVDPSIRLCQASSSEMYGSRSTAPQSETTSFDPRSPYGAAKLYAHSMIGVYRRRYGLHASSAILFNHESPLRPDTFVTRKITRSAARIRLGLDQELLLGSVSSQRDWGFAGDYVRAMWLMAFAPAADDYVVATGRRHSVEELCAHAFAHVGLDWRRHVRVDPSAVRQQEDVELVGDATRLHRELGWRPSVVFEELVRTMVDADLLAAQSHHQLNKG